MISAIFEGWLVIMASALRIKKP